MEKRNLIKERQNIGVNLTILLLIFIILGLTFYILYDKGILNKTTKSDKNIVDKNLSKEDNERSLNITDESIQKLFKNSHNNIGIDKKIFTSNELKVETMTEDYKINVAASSFFDKIVYYDQITQTQNGGITQELKEIDIKSSYEQVFGPNTYKRLDKFSIGCGDFNYNSTTKTYQNKTDGCGGTTAFYNVEDIISATKYNDRIEIVSAVIFIDEQSNAMYKDYGKNKKIRDLTAKELENAMNSPSEDSFKSYIRENKDTLEQYTYTYKLNSNGFYYYTGVKKTKN